MLTCGDCLSIALLVATPKKGRPNMTLQDVLFHINGLAYCPVTKNDTSLFLSTCRRNIDPLGNGLDPSGPLKILQSQGSA